MHFVGPKSILCAWTGDDSVHGFTMLKSTLMIHVSTSISVHFLSCALSYICLILSVLSILADRLHKSLFSRRCMRMCVSEICI